MTNGGQRRFQMMVWDECGLLGFNQENFPDIILPFQEANAAEELDDHFRM